MPWIKFAFVNISLLIFVDGGVIMEQYVNEVGSVAFELCDVFDPDYRWSTLDRSWRVAHWCD